MSPHRREQHLTHRIGWLRAAVLGANDGIVSTASLVVGVAAAGTDERNVLIAGIAAVVAGAMSMAAGEYVSVSSQADIERADLEREQRELEGDPAYETDELTAIYIGRGLDPALARQVAERLMKVDPLGAHARDELGLSRVTAARPLQAAATSLAAFATGGSLPLLIVITTPPNVSLVPVVATSALFFLAMLGGLAARTGGAPVIRGVARVTLWGALAMATTAAIGALVGAV